jgi:2-methylcitrate dehydratase PrpD
LPNDPIVLQLAHWINSFRYDGVPGHIVERAKFSLLDAIGGAFAATSYSRAAKDALNVIELMGGTGPCTIIGESRRASVADAVFANGLLIRALDFNDYLPCDPNDGASWGAIRATIWRSVWPSGNATTRPDLIFLPRWSWDTNLMADF